MKTILVKIYIIKKFLRYQFSSTYFCMGTTFECWAAPLNNNDIGNMAGKSFSTYDAGPAM